MTIEVLKSKIHRVTVTEANLNYVGSVTIDEELLEAANILAGEKVQIVNVNNGERIETYAIRGERGRGQVCLNGAAARKAAVGGCGNHHLLRLDGFRGGEKVHTVGGLSRYGYQPSDKVGRPQSCLAVS